MFVVAVTSHKPGDGRHVSTERELAEGWKPYRNPTDPKSYDDWFAEGPPAPKKDYRTGQL